MKIRRDVLATRDIDWFCIISGIPIHAASAGGIVLPDLVNDRKMLIRLQMLAWEMPDVFEDIHVNKDCIERKLRQSDEIGLMYNEEDYEVEGHFALSPELTWDERIERYASSFVFFARKGFLSFDRSNLDDPESTLYDLIAFPIHDKFEAFPIHDKFKAFPINPPMAQNNMFVNIQHDGWLKKNIKVFEQVDMLKILTLPRNI